MHPDRRGKHRKGLASLLCKFFIDGKPSAELFDEANGVLGTYSSRAKLAYCLGLIPDALFQNIKQIAKIRNAFAHSHIALDFDNPEVAQLCRKLTVPVVAETVVIGHPPHLPAFFQALTATPRGRFTLASINTVSSVIMIALATERRKSLDQGN